MRRGRRSRRKPSHQEATSPAPDTAPVTGALSDDKLSRLLSPLADAPPDKRLDVRDVETRVLDSKTKQVVATLPADIRDHEKASGKVVPDEVRLKMTEDLTKQSEALSKSGLAVDAIRQRNEQTLRAIDSAIGTRPYSPQSYQVAMLEIFDTLVPLSILSTPDGASVSVEGNPIGSTNIADKPFKPKTYKFKFQLTGYADADREYTVAAGLLSDSFTQVLTPVSTSGSPPTTGPSREPVPEENPLLKFSVSSSNQFCTIVIEVRGCAKSWMNTKCWPSGNTSHPPNAYLLLNRERGGETESSVVALMSATINADSSSVLPGFPK